MKIYVASSWRNQRQPTIVECLRRDGHEVYDFRNPPSGGNGFHWSEIDPNWERWGPAQFAKGLQHPTARGGFASDMRGLHWCDACVMVQPCGRSAALELGWACGAEKLTAVLLSSGEPELMITMADIVACTVEQLLDSLKQAKVLHAD